MAALTLRAHGAAPVGVAWERYADPQLWPAWAPQIQRVETDMRRLAAGASGVVHAGPLPRPTIAVPFQILEVDESAREWSWQVSLGLLRLRLEHGVTTHPTGSSTWLRIHGNRPVIFAYAPLARIALVRLVAYA